MKENATSTTGTALVTAKRIDLRGKSPLTKILPTDRISFDKQAELIRAFAASYESNSSKAVSNEKAGQVMNPAIAAGTVIQVNAFFVDTGILTRPPDGTGFIPSPECLAYHKACQWGGTERAGVKLRTLLEQPWFSKALVPRLQLGSRPIEECLGILAEQTEATKEHRERLVNILKFLQLATIIKIEGSAVSLQWPGRYSEDQTPPTPSDMLDGEAKPLPVNGQITKMTPPVEGSEQHTLYLSSDKKRIVTIAAPLTISDAEYKRITEWIKVTLIVGEEKQL